MNLKYGRSHVVWEGLQEFNVISTISWKRKSSIPLAKELLVHSYIRINQKGQSNRRTIIKLMPLS